MRYLCAFIKSFIPPSNLSTFLSVPMVIRTNLFILRYSQTFFLAFLNFAVPIMAKNNNCLQLFGVLNCYNSERTFQRGGEMMTEEKFIYAVKRNSRRLFVIAFSYLKNKHDAEDALQNAFLKLWKSKIEFNDDLGIDKWLTKVLVNDCKNFFNLSFRQNKSIEEVYDVSTFDKYFNVDLYNAVMSLNKKERLCVILFYYDDLTISDISKVTGIKESTVKSLLKRSRNKLKLMLGDEWIYEQ